MAESNQHNTLVPQSYNPAHAQQAPSTVANCSGGAPPPPTNLNRMLSIGEVLKRIPVVRRTLIRWERKENFPAASGRRMAGSTGSSTRSTSGSSMPTAGPADDND